MQALPRKAVIPAAGIGTRLLPATKSQPKEMLPVGRCPVIQYVVEEVRAAGINQILIITNQQKRAIEDHFDYDSHLLDSIYRTGKSTQEVEDIGKDIEIFYVRQGAPKGLADAIKILIDTQKGDNQNEVPKNQRDLPASAINIFSLLAVLLVGFVYYNITESAGITILTTFIMIIMAFFFTAVASYIVGLVGNSNSPVSGMTITAVLFTGGMLYVFGFSGTEGMVATLGVAAIVCCAACTSGDVCNDLKTGQIVGSRPYRQQIMQIIGVGVASLVMAPILQLLHENTPGGIGGRELAAPQAGLFASLANGFFGDGNLPLDMVAIGAVLGILILTLDYFLFDKNKPGGFRLHLMPIAVGMYLPFGLSTPILIGGLIAYFLTKRSKLANTDDHVLQNGVLLSSGLIAGESLMGILLALFASAGITSINLGLQPGFVTGLTFLSAAGVIWWLYKKSAIQN